MENIQDEDLLASASKSETGEQCRSNSTWRSRHTRYACPLFLDVSHTATGRSRSECVPNKEYSDESLALIGPVGGF
jgi:hypothetical protein